MQELIKILTEQIGKEQVNAVSARDVWKFVGSRQDFSTWVRSRFDELEAVENEDYISFSQSSGTIISSNGKTASFSEKNGKPQNKGGRPSIEYIVTITLAKEMAMLERNEKGREIRRYFINFEKQGKIKIILLQKQIQILEKSVASANRLINFYKDMIASIEIDDKIANLEQEKENLKDKGFSAYFKN